ncbi:hypothetical protein [Yeguia hominis]|uniref:Uncharacterized protein n=1 Tax=Yeguia hominis TaxID=2763662 RepID=A0A926D9C7_9FIRM|nr:hypothetical protein [Yeguia hominis]MBC8533724.1 hypothetical protein [Yeguia hominis]
MRFSIASNALCPQTGSPLFSSSASAFAKSQIGSLFRAAIGAKASLRDMSISVFGGVQNQKRTGLHLSNDAARFVLVVPKATPGYAGGKKIAYSEE